MNAGTHTGAPLGIAYQVALVGAIGILPVVDAVPFELIGRSARLAGAGAVSIFSLSCFVWAKATAASFYSTYNVPEFRIEGYVSISSFRILCQSYWFLGVFSLHILYRLYFHPAHAVHVDEHPSLQELHRQGAKLERRETSSKLVC